MSWFVVDALALMPPCGLFASPRVPVSAQGGNGSGIADRVSRIYESREHISLREQKRQ